MSNWDKGVEFEWANPFHWICLLIVVADYVLPIALIVSLVWIVVRLLGGLLWTSA